MDSVSYEAKSFIKEMLTLDPKKRPTAAEALRHPWFASIQPDIHLQESINGIRLFNAQQKLRGAMFMFHATTTLIGGLDQTPPFMKYLTHSNKMSTVIESKSQTDPHKIHYIDFSRIFHQYTLRDLCTCGSKMICRHVQNVHEYLFVGRSDMDVQPFINELLSIKEELRLSLEEDPSNKESNIKYVELGNVIHAANVFHDVFLKAPASEMKPNHMLHLSPPQRLSQENNRARSILKAYQQVGE